MVFRIDIEIDCSRAKALASIVSTEVDGEGVPNFTPRIDIKFTITESLRTNG